jgi:virginiamycin B lyase
MRTRRLLQILTAGLAVILFQWVPQIAAQNQPPAALTGQVTSEAMEGVVVSAKKAGSTVTVSVVSDAKGRYRFPANRLEAGKYSIKIRAAGYDLAAQRQRTS